VDIFEKKDIAPMLIGRDEAAFDSDDFIYELKWDGIRCIAYLWEDGHELRNKRNKSLNATYPELNGIHKQAKARCILDGELVILKDGKPYFHEIQRRSLMTNAMKIKLAAQKLPVCFVAYDILYIGNEQITNKPLLERKALLADTITQSAQLAYTSYIEHDGTVFYQLAADKELEGVVAKRKDSKYYFDKRSPNWVKFKALLDEDFVVCGYYGKGGHSVSVIIGAYDNDTIVYQGHVTMGVSRQDYKEMQAVPVTSKENFYTNFPEFEGATWLAPLLVCKVEYMERTPKGGLRQPRFRGVRHDKAAHECVLKK